MENNTQEKKYIRLKASLNILIVLLGILFVVVVFSTVKEFLDLYDNGYSIDSFYARTNDADYAPLPEMYYINEAERVEANSQFQEYYGVAKYVEAASYYRMYSENNDMQRAEAYREKMEQALSQMGVYSSLSDQINTKLGL